MSIDWRTAGGICPGLECSGSMCPDTPNGVVMNYSSCVLHAFISTWYHLHPSIYFILYLYRASSVTHHDSKAKQIICENNDNSVYEVFGEFPFEFIKSVKKLGN